MKNNDEIVSVKVQLNSKVELLEEDSKFVFFHKGDLVKHKRLENSPTMLVDKVIFKTDREGNFILDGLGKKILHGVQCSWFNLNLDYVTYVFNSKDLSMVDELFKITDIDSYE